MSNNQKHLQSTIVSEGNPKAVFIGEKTGVVGAIADYLHEASVDLYSGNELGDALFGQYFFYIGNEENVKTFLVENISKLPKGLLILPKASDFLIEIINKKDHKIKLLLIDYRIKCKTEDIQTIFNFFLGSQSKILQHKSSLIMKDVEKKTPVVFKTIQKTPKPIVNLSNLKSVSKEQKNITQNLSLINTKTQKTNETHNKIKTFYDQGKNQETPELPERKKTKSKKTFFVSLFIIFLFFITPIFSLVFSSLIGYWQLSQIEKNIRLNKMQNISLNVKIAKSSFFVSEKSLMLVSPIFDIFKQREFLNQANKFLNICQKSLSSINYLISVQEDTVLLFKQISGQKAENNINYLTSKIKGNLNLADTEMALVEAQNKSSEIINFWELPQFGLFKKKYENFSNIVSELRRVILVIKNGLSILPQAIPDTENKKYLVIFQNNMELRPTGGFIGSFALVDFDKGVLQKINVEDVYTADGALMGHVDPPDAIRAYLGQEHWYLRDSNWDPDFAKSAQKIIWFLEKELDQKVDGVVAIDLVATQYFLENLGPIKIPDFDITISAKDLFVVAQREAQVDFFPGSTKKKDFLGALGKEMISEILQNNNSSNIGLFQKIYTAISEKHIQFYFNNPTLQEYVNKNDWGGSLSFVSNCGQDCIADYFALVDANLGVNKSNYYLKRDFKDEVNILENGRIRHKLTVNYKNDSPVKDVLLGGSYKNYFRLYLPKNIELFKASIDGLALDIKPGKIASSGSVLVQTKDNLTNIEGLIEVKPQSQKAVVFTYERKDVFEPSLSPQKYSYLVRKQAGTLADNISILLTYPSKWQIDAQALPKDALVKGNTIEYNTSLLKDLNFSQLFK